MSGLYGADLAHVQEQGFGDFVRGAAPGLLAMLREGGVRRGRVVDLGCGDGAWLHALDRAGYEALGVELSPDLAAAARRRAPGARLVVGSAHEVALPPCDAITALGEVLGYLPPGGRAPSLPRLFRRAARALRPGGLLIFDLVVAGEPPMAYRTWTQGEGWAVLVEVSEQPARARLAREIVTFRDTGGARYRRAEERHRLQVPTRAAVEAALREAGFTVRVQRRYGAYAMRPRRLAFRARRRGGAGGT